jgi:hypothetical protein
MGRYLNHVNNDTAAPNENFARELLQLFTIGPCQLTSDGKLAGGRCSPPTTTTRPLLRLCADGLDLPARRRHALGRLPARGRQLQVPRRRHGRGEGTLRDTHQRALLSGVKVPANAGAGAALDLVLDSLMAHPNMGPFVGRHLIQQLVTSNPSNAMWPAWRRPSTAAAMTASAAA